MTILLTSHYHKDIEELCQRVILLNHGKLLFDGPLSSVDESFQGQRVVDIYFKTKEMVQEFEKYLHILKNKNLNFTVGKSQEENSITLTVAMKESQELLALIFHEIPPDSLLDLKINEQPIEEFFSQLYSLHA